MVSLQMHYASESAMSSDRVALLKMQLSQMPFDLLSSCVEELRKGGLLARARLQLVDEQPQDYIVRYRSECRRQSDSDGWMTKMEIPPNTKKQSKPLALSHMCVSCPHVFAQNSFLRRFDTYFTHRFSHELSAEYTRLHEALHNRRQQGAVDVIEERGGYLPLVANMIGTGSIEFDSIDTNHYLQMHIKNEEEVVRDPQAILRMAGFCASANDIDKLVQLRGIGEGSDPNGKRKLVRASSGLKSKSEDMSGLQLGHCPLQVRRISGAAVHDAGARKYSLWAMSMLHCRNT